MADKEDTNKRNSLDWVKQKAAAVAIKAEQKAAEMPSQLFLPGFDIGAFPNHLNRSSFIAPIARGRRKFHRQAEMVTRKDCVLEYTGEQLDEADGDLIMALIAFAQPYALGTPVPLNRKELLRKIKTGSIGQQRDMTHARQNAATHGLRRALDRGRDAQPLVGIAFRPLDLEGQCQAALRQKVQEDFIRRDFQQQFQIKHRAGHDSSPA